MSLEYALILITSITSLGVLLYSIYINIKQYRKNGDEATIDKLSSEEASVVAKLIVDELMQDERFNYLADKDNSASRFQTTANTLESSNKIIDLETKIKERASGR